MGYYTSYELEISDVDKTTEVVLALGDVIGYALDENLETYEDVKWYSHSDDMKDLSLKFPDMLFTLTGNGEESGDIWGKYFLNGKSQLVKPNLVLPEFNASELK